MLVVYGAKRSLDVFEYIVFANLSMEFWQKSLCFLAASFRQVLIDPKFSFVKQGVTYRKF